MGPALIFDWLPDFIKLYFARTIFRANSSFSWWAGFLSPTAKVYSPVIHRQAIYGRDSYEEVDYEFVEGNHPHWMFGCGDIHFKEERAPLLKPRWCTNLGPLGSRHSRGSLGSLASTQTSASEVKGLSLGGAEAETSSEIVGASKVEVTE